MLRARLTLALTLLLTVVALAVALLAIADASKADNDIPKKSVSETPAKAVPDLDDSRSMNNSTPAPSLKEGQEQSASVTQYANEDEDSRRPDSTHPVGSPEVQASSTVYYEFYSRWLAREGGVEKVSKVEDTLSEGSAPGVRAPAEALSIMEPSTPYSQVVDNALPRRFLSPRGWKKGSKGAISNSKGAISNRTPHYGNGYEYTRPAKEAGRARFKMRIPTAGYYTVYARWPAAKGNNPATRFRISTANGIKNAEVNQRKDGDVWVRLGAYKMKAGDRYSVQVAGHSEAKGQIVADAVKVVAGTQAPPQAHTSNDGAANEPAGGETSTGANVRGAQVIERARTHIGTPYRHSPPLPCIAYRSEDCSCFTRLVYSKWLTLLDDPVQQWQVGRNVEKSALQPGDLIFFKEAGESNPITHVGIYSGNGNIIHSSSYWGKVVERPMSSVSGYYGAKRVR